MKKCLFVCVALLWPGIATAQATTSCPSIIALNDLPETTVPDIQHQPIAHPGAFGGSVACVLRARGQGTERFFAEFLPSDGILIEDFFYRNNQITYYMKFDKDGEKRAEVGGCTGRNTGGLLCMLDLAAGDGFRLMRFFNAAQEFTGIRLVAVPNSGIVNTFFWETMKDYVENDPNTSLRMTATIPETGQVVDLTLLEESTPGRPMYGISGQPAYDFMLALYRGDGDVVIKTEITRLIGSQQTVSAVEKTLPSGNISYLIDRLAQVEQLMVAGYDASRALDFRRQ